MINFLQPLSTLDPGPIFVISLFPYLIFLSWAQKSTSIPKTSLWGFRLTLLFVAMTIVCSIIAKVNYDQELTDVDYLHGSAEAFLALSDAFIVYGFAAMLKNSSEYLLRGSSSLCLNVLYQGE